jgi:hypothetical protein
VGQVPRPSRRLHDVARDKEDALLLPVIALSHRKC